MNSTVRPLKGQTICAANVRLQEGKHGLVEEGQGETKAQVKDVPAPSYHPIILPKKKKKKIDWDRKQYVRCFTLSHWNMQKINSHLLLSINHWLKMLCIFLFSFLFSLAFSLSPSLVFFEVWRKLDFALWHSGRIRLCAAVRWILSVRQQWPKTYCCTSFSGNRLQLSFSDDGAKETHKQTHAHTHTQTHYILSARYTPYTLYTCLGVTVCVVGGEHWLTYKSK